MKFLNIVFLISLFCITSVHPQMFSPDERKILGMQDSRTLGENNEVLNYLNSENEALVKRTLIALTNIQDTATCDEIGELLLKNPSAEIRKLSAFSLGQIPSETSEIYLLKSLLTESNDDILSEVITSLGKAGSSSSLDEVLKFNNENEEIKKAKAMAVFFYSMRNIKTQSGVDFLKSLINGNSAPGTRKAVAYAFYRFRDRDLMKSAVNEIESLAKSDDEHTRMWAFSALGKIAGPQFFETLLDSYETENIWNVKVNILNSIPDYIKNDVSLLNDRLTGILLNAKDDENINVRITALKVIGAVFSSAEKNQKEKIRNKLVSCFDKSISADWREIGECFLIYGMIFKDESEELLFENFKDTGSRNLKPYIIRAFGYFENGVVYKKVREIVSAQVQAYTKQMGYESGRMVQDRYLAELYLAFVETIGELASKVNDDERNLIRLMLSEFLSSKNPAIVDVCLNMLDKDIFAKYRDETALLIMYDFKELSYPEDKEVMKLFINRFGLLKYSDAVGLLEKYIAFGDDELASYSVRALKEITGKDYSFEKSLKTFYDWDYVESLAGKKNILIETEKGDIKVELFPEYTPFTVRNLISLIEKDFYEGLFFHRVVPNFVIQGGDPLGNGWGGLDYTIRTEIFPSNFETGYVGIASEGKDTEGCQFFIMHSPHYHLDGRYTLCGKVTEGMDVVNQIYIYDKILSVSILYDN
ncbi:MAG: peptidylprolyl isomerase [Ignavibacteria bacterium]|nr:peptidylprolyl isomerase [Ignavibacteria bacterium]